VRGGGGGGEGREGGGGGGGGGGGRGGRVRGGGRGGWAGRGGGGGGGGGEGGGGGGDKGGGEGGEGKAWGGEGGGGGGEWTLKSVHAGSSRSRRPSSVGQNATNRDQKTVDGGCHGRFGPGPAPGMPNKEKDQVVRQGHKKGEP